MVRDNVEYWMRVKRELASSSYRSNLDSLGTSTDGGGLAADVAGAAGTEGSACLTGVVAGASGFDGLLLCAHTSEVRDNSTSSTLDVLMMGGSDNEMSRKLLQQGDRTSS